LFFDYHRQNGVTIRIARIFNTYGPRMAVGDGRVVSNFIVQAMQGEDLTVYGDGSHSRSFCYVDDMVEGILRHMAHPSETGPINLGTEKEYTMLELAEMVIRLVGGSSRIAFRELPPDDPSQRCPDISKAREMLDWEPRVSLRDGLSETINYFRTQLA
jgi:UDP-glucuronate decarboxylase